MNDIAPAQKAVPEPDGRSQPFFDGANDGVLRLQRCLRCDTWMWPVRARCIACASPALEWCAASGTGIVHSYSWVHHTSDPAFAAEAPFNVALVDLNEGVRIFTTVIDIDPDSLRIDLPVHVVFERLSPEVSVPKFAPND